MLVFLERVKTKTVVSSFFVIYFGLGLVYIFSQAFAVLFILNIVVINCFFFLILFFFKPAKKRSTAKQWEKYFIHLAILNCKLFNFAYMKFSKNCDFLGKKKCKRPPPLNLMDIHFLSKNVYCNSPFHLDGYSFFVKNYTGIPLFTLTDIHFL